MWRIINEARVVQDCSSEKRTGILIGDKIYQLPCFPVCKVGQVMVVKAVDATGRPVEWAAVDMSSTPGSPSIDGNIATDEEVKSTINDIFGENTVNE